MKKIIFVLLGLYSFQIQADSLTNILSRTSDFKDIDYICVDKNSKFISFDSLLSNNIITDYQNKNIPFDLYIHNNGVKEKINNNVPIKLGNTYSTCENNKLKYKIEIQIDKEDIINSPENTFYNTLTYSTFNENIVTNEEEIEIIYTTQSVALQIKQLKDFNFNHNPNSSANLSLERDFCVYTDGSGTYEIKAYDNSGAPNFMLINENNSSETINYSVSFRTDSYPTTPLSNNIYATNIDGNTDFACASGDKSYLKIDIANSELSSKQAGIYYPNNAQNVIYLSVRLELIAPF